MPERLGVTYGLRYLSENVARCMLKRALLLFDAVVLGDTIDGRSTDVPADLRREVDWLSDQRLIRLAQWPTAGMQFKGNIASAHQEAMAAIVRSGVALGTERRKAMILPDDVADHRRVVQARRDVLVTRVLDAKEAFARLSAVVIRATTDAEATLITSATGFRPPSTTTDTVVRIVLNSLPILDDKTPWEAILDYRRDPASNHHLTALRRWMRAVAQDERSSADIEDELRYALHEYEEHIRHHRLKYYRGALVVILTTAADVIEHILRLKFGTAARALFSVAEQRAALLEAERLAPGRELAFIVNTGDALRSAVP